MEITNISRIKLSLLNETPDIEQVIMEIIDNYLEH